MAKRLPRETLRDDMTLPIITSEMTSIVECVQADFDDPNIAKSIRFSPTALKQARNVLLNGGTIITDTLLVRKGIDRASLDALGLQCKCFINEPSVLRVAESRCATRAEVALDLAMTAPGLKMFVIGSAPATLSHLLSRYSPAQLHDAVIVATVTGFVNAVQLKERLFESGYACVIVRGKKGGVSAAISLTNAILRTALEQLD
ncbi:MAG: precorrin-8X methylmutase [Christensenellales bacterium]|jgi:precorrin-8X/cobalt-precorrin-8 methylmutase